MGHFNLLIFFYAESFDCKCSNTGTSRDRKDPSWVVSYDWLQWALFRIVESISRMTWLHPVASAISFWWAGPIVLVLEASRCTAYRLWELSIWFWEDFDRFVFCAFLYYFLSGLFIFLFLLFPICFILFIIFFKCILTFF